MGGDVTFHMALTHENQSFGSSPAEKLYRELLVQFPQHAVIIQQLASSCFKAVQGEKNGEKQFSRNFLVQDDFISEAEFHQNVELLQIASSKLMHKSPKDRALIVFLIGRSYLSFKQPAQAVPYFNQAVQLDGTCPSYWFYLGRALTRSNEKTEAIHSFARALKMNPNLAEVWIELALEYESHQLFCDAVRCAEKAYELRKDELSQTFLQNLKDQMDSEVPESTLASGTILCPPPAVNMHQVHEDSYMHSFETDLNHFVHSYAPFGGASFNHLEIDGRIIETEFV